MTLIQCNLSLKFLCFVGLTFLFCPGYSQSKSYSEIIAEGGSKLKVKPDIAVFTLTVEKTDTIERNVIKNLNLAINDLTQSLNKVGFTNEAIKISDYEISSSSYREEETKKRYSASSVLKLEFRLDTKMIDAIYREIQEAGLSDLDIEFETKVSDSLERKKRLILVQQAIEDAKTNAVAISKSLGVEITKVKKVSKYKEGVLGEIMEVKMIQFTPPKIVGDTQIKFDTSFDKFQVEDIELEEKITIVFEIQNK